MRKAGTGWRLKRLSALLALLLGVLGTVGWLTMHATPAAQRSAQRIEPYDPLK